MTTNPPAGSTVRPRLNKDHHGEEQGEQKRAGGKEIAEHQPADAVRMDKAMDDWVHGDDRGAVVRHRQAAFVSPMLPKLQISGNHFLLSDGRGSRIRTCDPLLPKQMRYQAALCPEPADIGA
jgi:hypothetical protein